MRDCLVQHLVQLGMDVGNLFQSDGAMNEKHRFPITNLGPVHTNADSKVYGFFLPKMHQLIRVHTTVFIAFPTVHTNTPH